MSTRTYIVDDGPVTLEVVIGEGQKGRISIVVDGKEVVRGDGRVRKQLGSGLAGATVEIFTVVSHTNPQSSRLEVSCIWSGGPQPQTDIDRGDFNTDPDPSFVEPIYELAAAE
jgi:hypothetical protein